MSIAQLVSLLPLRQLSAGCAFQAGSPLQGRAHADCVHQDRMQIPLQLPNVRYAQMDTRPLQPVQRHKMCASRVLQGFLLTHG